MISAAVSMPNIVAAAVMKTFLEPFPLLLDLIAFPSALLSQCQQTAAAGSMQSLKPRQPSAVDCWPGLQSPSTGGQSWGLLLGSSDRNSTVLVRASTSPDSFPLSYVGVSVAQL